jgi:hypothetical protein
MRAIYFLLLIFTSLSGFGQENNVDTEAVPERFKLYYYAPVTFGDNMLSKAHTNDFNGFGLSLTLFRIKQVHVNIAFEHNSFTVSDVSLAGNSTKSNFSNYLIEGMYKFQFTGQMAINPKIAIGTASIDQSNGRQDFGTQYGVSFNIGGEFDYKIAGRLRAFAGLGYSYISFNINTAPELKSFYGNAHMLNLSMGLKI